MRKLFYILVFGALTVLGGEVQAQDLNGEEVRKIIRADEQEFGGELAVSVVDCASNKEVFAYRGSERLTPASVVKILSTGAALQSFGRGYRFPTLIYGTGGQKGRTYKGNIVIVGQGDPSIASNYIEGEEERLSQEIIKVLKGRRINNINGRLIVNAYLSEEQGAIPSWQLDDIGWYYGTGLYGFNYKDNKFSLKVGTHLRYGRRPRRLTWDKDLPIKFLNRMKVSRRERLTTYATPKEHYSEILLKGTVPRRRQSYEMHLANPDPALYAARELSKSLKKAGIKLRYKARANYEESEVKGEVLHYYFSKPIDTLARITNHRSHNLFAEGFAALVANGEERGEAIDNYWTKRLGLAETELILADGSGLSRKDRLTARTLTSVLDDLLSDEMPEKSSMLYTLPKVGEEGTVSSLLSKDLIDARLKSGSMSGVVCYAGYVHYQGKWYAIALLSNHFNRNSNARNSIRSVLRTLFPLNQNK